MFHRLFFFLSCAIVTNMAAAVTPFELPWVNSESASFRSADYPESVFVVETYFQRCSGCNSNAPKVNALSREFSEDERVHVLDVSKDCRASDYDAWIERHNPNHPVLNDCTRTLIDQLAPTSYPATFILDGNLNIIYEHAGEWDSFTAFRMKREIRKLLENSARR